LDAKIGLTSSLNLEFNHKSWLLLQVEWTFNKPWPFRAFLSWAATIFLENGAFSTILVSAQFVRFLRRIGLDTQSFWGARVSWKNK
jgi:hypothetical protein